MRDFARTLLFTISWLICDSLIVIGNTVMFFVCFYFFTLKSDINLWKEILCFKMEKKFFLFFLHTFRTHFSCVIYITSNLSRGEMPTPRLSGSGVVSCRSAHWTGRDRPAVREPDRHCREHRPTRLGTGWYLQGRAVPAHTPCARMAGPGAAS